MKEGILMKKKYWKIMWGIFGFSLIMCIVTGSYVGINAKHAINEIGKVEYKESCQKKIDYAVKVSDKLEGNIGDSLAFKKFVETSTGKKTLDNAKKKYTRLAIRTAKVSDERKEIEGYSEDDIRNLVKKARIIVDTYYPEESYPDKTIYNELKSLETQYDEDSKINENKKEEKNLGEYMLELCP